MTEQGHYNSFSYPAEERVILNFVRDILEGEKKSNLLLTGAIGSGKSTFVQHLIDHMAVMPTGYMTIRHIDADERRQGFAHVPAANQRGTGFLTIRHDEHDIFPMAQCFLVADPDGRRFNLDRFHETAMEFMDRPGSLMILDELGGDELLIDDFYERVLALLEDTTRPTILVWKHDKSFERSISRAKVSEADINKIKERRRVIASHPSLVNVELVNGGLTISDKKRALWRQQSAEPQTVEEEPLEIEAVPRLKKSMAPRFAIMLGALLLIVIFSFAVGWYWIDPKTIVVFFWHKIIGSAREFPTEIHSVLINVRLPRIVLGLLVGSGLSVAGHTFQGVFRNPMASPDVLGASSGAGFGAALAILWGLPSSGITSFSFLFGLLSIVLVLVLTSFVRGQKMLALILTGIVVGSLFSAGLSLIKLVADPTDQLPAITYWLMGSLNSAQVKQLAFAGPIILVALFVILLLRWQLNVLTVGEDAAATMGIHTRLLQLILIIAATLITATCVSVSGVIGWVGLVVPHIARMITGADNRYSLPASALIGSAFMIFVDDIARRATTSGIPLGILTAFIGAPFFIYLILRQGRRDAIA
ncbi:MAG: iron chelate uptake ABC transporter family permease subunit [Clostridiales bacterium]|jgi:iron complex transport system permease protein|nr:iron chelate uptake ABC transporter family permease subunit [Clostridiales bacterium]MCK9349929.1 iron chelate uptake ABC transporter family permease subunit [Clostridiales bacterium]NLG29848.1 iron chelate uptake ABC transporter family permease subunit [Clostridiaceae bacterium]